MKELIKSLEAMKEFARRFVSELQPQEGKATIVGLYGDLGAGKTTFTQAVAEALGVHERVVSPTFVIMKFYETGDMRQEVREKDSQSDHASNLTPRISAFTRLIHIDAYRLEKSSELTNLGWQEIISNPENLVLIEWPERVVDVMPEHIKIHFTHMAENEREVEVVA